MPAPAHFSATVSESFSLGQTHYGEIDISLDQFTDYIWIIVCRRLRGPLDDSSVDKFTKRLYLRDLYLTCGCVFNNEKAWTALDLRYRKFVNDLARACYPHGTDNEEIADSVLVSLYFNDRSGKKRIASYDGRSSLATWLRVIVINRAINDRHERRVASEESMIDLPDNRALTVLENSMLSQRYGNIVTESLVQALGQISPKERLMLLWRYEQNLQLGEIAELMGIHQSNVTRQLLRVQTRLREAVVNVLATHHHFSSSAIEECFTDVVENPQISIPIMNLIKQTAKPSAASVDSRHESRLYNQLAEGS